jgi:hypothetical protein
MKGAVHWLESVGLAGRLLGRDYRSRFRGVGRVGLELLFGGFPAGSEGKLEDEHGVAWNDGV